MFFFDMAAVFGSIEKWRRIYNGGTNHGTNDCPLCITVRRPTGFMRHRTYCENCPICHAVQWKTGLVIGGCNRTPYTMFVRINDMKYWVNHSEDEWAQARQVAAQAELDFLSELYDDLYCIDQMAGMI